MRPALLLSVALGALPASAQTPCINGFAGPYPCQNVDLVSTMTVTQLGTVTNVADLWGWTDPVTGKEYAIVGGRSGTSFVDLSTPTAPVLVGFLPTHNGVSSLWRDVDTHGNWCFVGSEAAGHGLQVFDLTRLRTVTNPPAAFTEDAHFGGFGNSHTIFADKTEPYVYAVGANVFSGGLIAVNVSNPLAPVLAGTFTSEGYIHENAVFLYNGPDTEHVGKRISFNFHINSNDRVTITDVSDKTDITLIGTTPIYQVRSLCHQGWLTEDHRFLLMNDEGDEQLGNYNTRTHIFNIENLEAPAYIGWHSGPNASYDHNNYVHQGLLWQANYTSGMQVLDLANVASGTLTQVASFDNYPANNGRSYNGAWGNYPYFASGIVIVSSYGEGLFVLRPKLALNLRVLLDGPYVAGEDRMHDSLRVRGLIPLTEPYTGLGYSHVSGGGGEIIAPAVLAVTGTNAIVDWVVVELRDVADPSVIVSTRSALLQRDGDVVRTDGTSAVQFDVAVNDYHVAVRHRNHLGVMTAAPVRVSVAPRSYDLSNGSVALFGVEPTKQVGTRRTLWSGNTLGDDVLRYTGSGNDRDPILVRVGGALPTATTTGYHAEDVGMDGTVRYVGAQNDRDPILLNVGGSVPTNTRAEQLP